MARIKPKPSISQTSPTEISRYSGHISPAESAFSGDAVNGSNCMLLGSQFPHASRVARRPDIRPYGDGTALLATKNDPLAAQEPTSCEDPDEVDARGVSDEASKTITKTSFTKVPITTSTVR